MAWKKKGKKATTTATPGATSIGKANKMGAKKTVLDGITFASQMEADYYLYLQEEVKEGRVLEFKLQPEFILLDGYTKYGRKIRPITYIGDYYVWYEDGTEKVIDVKGKETADFKLKRKMFDSVYPDLTLQLVKLLNYKLMLKAEGWIDFDEDKRNKAKAKREANKVKAIAAGTAKPPKPKSTKSKKKVS